MQSSRHLNLSIPPVVEGKEHRSYLQLKMDYAFLGCGRTQFKVDKALIRQAVKAALGDSNFMKAGHALSSQTPDSSSSCRLLQMEANYASTPKHFTVVISSTQSTSQSAQSSLASGEQALSSSLTLKEDNKAKCLHSCKFEIIDYSSQSLQL